MIMRTTHLFLSLILIISSLLCAAAQEHSPVIDIEGDEVRAGIDYNIVSAIWGAGGGGLLLASTGNKVCPLDVVQSPRDLINGFPLDFHPKDGALVRLSTDLNIKFNVSTKCEQSTVWTVEYDDSIQRYVVTTGGVIGNPGLGTLSNWFHFEKLGFGYKLVFCPSVCKFCAPICRDVVIYWDGSKRRLVLADQADENPFWLVIQKAGQLKKPGHHPN